MTTTYQVGRAVYARLEDVPVEALRVFRVTRGRRGIRHCELRTPRGNWMRIQPEAMLAGETVKVRKG